MKLFIETENKVIKIKESVYPVYPNPPYPGAWKPYYNTSIMAKNTKSKAGYPALKDMLNDDIGKLKDLPSKLAWNSILNLDSITMMQALDYELRSSLWASWISINWMQEISGFYFAWKTKRKYNRYLKSKRFEKIIKNNLSWQTSKESN